MGASYRWRDRTSPLNPIWPFAPVLLEDELLSSWLVRCALANGCDPLTLTGSVWPRFRFWCGDPDKHLSHERAAALSDLSGLEPCVIEGATLTSFRSLLGAESEYPNAVRPWILCLGIRNRRRSGGLQYCPQCFSEFEPHYGFQNRLSWHSGCPVHGLTFVDHCQDCGAPLCPQLLTCPHTNLARCHRCGFELRRAKTGTLSGDALLFQHAADTTLIEGVAAYGKELLDVTDWFYLCRWLLGILRSSAKTRSDCMRGFFDSLNIDFDALTLPVIGLPFEYLSPSDRAGLLANMWRMLRAGPERLLEASGLVPIAPSSIPQPVGLAPECVASFLSTLRPGRQKADNGRRKGMPRAVSNVVMRWQRLLRKFQR